MSYNRTQFRDLIERTLNNLDSALASDVAIDLLLGTAAQESAFGAYLKQVRGPAVGAFQIEPVTFEWLREKYSARYPEIEPRHTHEMEWDLRLAIIMARLRYRAVPAPLPKISTARSLGEYWKEYYNTPAGKGTVEQFMGSYIRYVG